MDAILQTYLDDFRNDFSFIKEELSKLFEHFVNYCLITKIDPDRTAIEAVNVGGLNNPGIDGMAIIVNDHVVTTKEQVDYFLELLGRLEVEFIFIQAKTSESFDMKDIGSFLTCVHEFFNESTTMKFEEEVLDLIAIKNYIYTKSIKIEKNPILKLYYATCGKYQKDDNLSATIDHHTEKLKRHDIFSNVVFNAIDREIIKKTYREIKNTITREIEFEKHTILPKISNVSESFIGILPGKEFLKLVVDDNGDLLRNIFYDNVRDFQGFNAVNLEIKNTIEKTESNDLFSLCNNGITIVAHKLNKIGYKFIISDFQIVNGCQTSHVLYYSKEKISANIYLPIKLIITDNYDVTASIIKATNRQTEVKSEAFEILSPFHKNLEEFYEAMDKKHNIKIYYERRSHQYDNQKINRSNIVTLSNQISSFVSMFLLEPHNAIQRYYGELLKLYRSKIFLFEHKVFPYFISGIYFSKIDIMFQEGELQKKYKRFKYHILMMFRQNICKNAVPKFNSHEIDRNCELMLDVFLDKTKFKGVIKEILTTIDEALKRQKTNVRNLHSTPSFTKLLGDSPENKTKGKIVYYNNVKGFGFFDIGVSSDIFFHISEYRKIYPDHNPSIGDEMSFDVVDDDTGSKAINLEYN